MTYMFFGCCSLTKLNLSNFKNFYLTDVYFMFAKCKSLIELDLSNIDANKCININNMLEGCSSLKKLIFPKFKAKIKK